MDRSYRITPAHKVGVFAFTSFKGYTLDMPLSDRVDRISELMEKVLEQQEKYETFLNASPWGILVVDKTFRIVYMNRTLEIMTGYSINELMGKHIKVFMEENIKNIHTKHEEDYLKNPKGREGNHGLHPRIVCKNGGILSVEISLSPTKVHGKTYFFASIRNIDSLFNTVNGEEK